MTPRAQALVLARDARSADEVERAMVALAALPDDAELVTVRAELSARFDAITAGRIPPVSRETSRYIDATRDPGGDNW